MLKTMFAGSGNDVIHLLYSQWLLIGVSAGTVGTFLNQLTSTTIVGGLVIQGDLTIGN